MAEEKGQVTELELRACVCFIARFQQRESLIPVEIPRPYLPLSTGHR